MSDPFDPAKLRVDAPPVPKASGLRRRKDQFVMVPLAWVSRLNTARHIGTSKVALHILFQHWKSGGKPIRMANAALERIGVPRREKWRALRELESFGLVKVIRRPRKSPEVTILNLPVEQS